MIILIELLGAAFLGIVIAIGLFQVVNYLLPSPPPPPQPKDTDHETN